jgi:hypothetical protein
MPLLLLLLLTLPLRRVSRAGRLLLAAAPQAAPARP